MNLYEPWSAGNVAVSIPKPDAIRPSRARNSAPSLHPMSRTCAPRGMYGAAVRMRQDWRTESPCLICAPVSDWRMGGDSTVHAPRLDPSRRMDAATPIEGGRVLERPSRAKRPDCNAPERRLLRRG